MKFNNSYLCRFPLFVATMFLILTQLPAQAESVRAETIPSKTGRTLSTPQKVTKPAPTRKKPSSTIPTRIAPVKSMQSGYCCIDGKTIRSSEKDCSRKRGNFFLQQSQAQKSCAATKGFCCNKGEVVADSQGSCDQKRGSFFIQERDAENQCAKQSGYCCSEGKVLALDRGRCEQNKGSFSNRRNEASRGCVASPTSLGNKRVFPERATTPTTQVLRTTTKLQPSATQKKPGFPRASTSAAQTNGSSFLNKPRGWGGGPNQPTPKLLEGKVGVHQEPGSQTKPEGSTSSIGPGGWNGGPGWIKPEGSTSYGGGRGWGGGPGYINLEGFSWGDGPWNILHHNYWKEK